MLTNKQMEYIGYAAIGLASTWILLNGAGLVPTYRVSKIRSYALSTDPLAPNAPSLSVAAGNNQITLTWTAPTIPTGGSAITGYNIYRGSTSGSEVLLVPAATVSNVLTYTDTTAINGTTYYYKVSAVNISGEGTLSSEVFTTPSQFAFITNLYTNLPSYALPVIVGSIVVLGALMYKRHHKNVDSEGGPRGDFGPRNIFVRA